MALRRPVTAVTAAGFATLLLLSPGRTPAEEMGGDMVKMTEDAKTPADHEALAVRYDTLATQAKSEAASHRAMAGFYKSAGGAKGATFSSMAQHCNNLVKSFDDEAANYTAMAAAHRQLAKAASK